MSTQSSGTKEAVQSTVHENISAETGTVLQMMSPPWYLQVLNRRNHMMKITQPQVYQMKLYHLPFLVDLLVHMHLAN